MSRASLPDAFHPDVRGFQTKDFSLEYELAWLDRLRGLEAPEAIILHCVRPMEVLAREVIGHLNIPSESPLENLKLLKSRKRLKGATFSWLTALHQMGNETRHALRAMTIHDADLAFAALLLGLRWYFCELHPGGPGLPALTLHTTLLESLLPKDLARLVKQLDDTQIDDQAFLASLRLDQPDSLVLVSPAIAAVLVELLQGRGRKADAEVILQAGLSKFPKDLRLGQLQGLSLSRAGELVEARTVLEGLRRTGTSADEETWGILAGVYKRCWQSQPTNRAWLMKCHDLYHKGWTYSQARNTYLGINAATTALFMGKTGVSRGTAEGIRTILEEREGSLAQAEEPGSLALDYWDKATVAEACLLLGDMDAARVHYRQAFERYRERTQDIQVTRDQARLILRALGRENEAASILGA